MIEIKNTIHGFTTMIPKPDYWNKETNEQLKRGFQVTLAPIKGDFCYHCKNDDEYIYILGDVPDKNIFENCIIEGVYYVIQYEFLEYIDTLLNKANKDIFCDLLNWVGIDCLYKTSEEIKELIKNEIEEKE